MTYAGLIRNFKIELDKLNVSSAPSFLLEEIDHWNNSAVEIFAKTRYSGTNIYGTGFQKNQKRSDDLRTLVVLKDFSGTDIVESTGFSYIEYPIDYMIGLGETAYIASEESCWPVVNEVPVVKRTDVIEATIENIDSKLNSPLSEHIYNHFIPKPIRLYEDGVIKLYTDGSYYIDRYVLTYIKNPEKLDYYIYPEFSEDSSYVLGDKVRRLGSQYECIVATHTELPWNESSFKEIELTIMPEHTWSEITSIAVRLALENISEYRYQTYSQESQIKE